MSNKPLVSVVIIFLNAEQFIQEAIDSVFAQTYDNWELLLVDDGSTDGSTKIALQYAQQYPGKVRYFEHDGHHNRGKSTSRNLGISKAKGEYIAFLDADDVFLPPKLKQQVAIMGSYPEAAMVYGPTQYWYSWTGNREDIQRDYIRKTGVQPNTLVHPPALLTLFLKDGSTIPCTCGLLARREVIEETGGFDESIQYMYEDQVFLAKICLKAPVVVESGCWDKYRQHPNSSCSLAKKTGEYYSARPTFLNWLEHYLSGQKIKDIELWQALQKALWPYRHPILHRLSGRVQHLMRQMKGLAKLIAQQTLPIPVYSWLREQWQGHGLAK